MHDLAGGKSPSDILAFLAGVQFPAKKDDLIHTARRNGAPSDVLGALANVPRTDIASPDELLDLYPRLLEQPGRKNSAAGEQP